MAETSLQTVWQRVARELGPTVVNTVVLEAVGSDPARWLISGALPHEGGEPLHVGRWVQITSGVVTGARRRIIHEVPELWAIAVDLVWPSTLAIGTGFEITYPLPITSQEGVVGLITLIQEACREVWFEDRLSIPTRRNLYAYSLEAYRDWLDSENLILRDEDGAVLFYDPPLVAGYPAQQKPWRYVGLDFRGGVPTLQIKKAYSADSSASGGFELSVMRPAYSLVSGAESTTGPAAASDTIAADADELVAVTLLRAYRYLATGAPHISDEERALYARKLPEQEAMVKATVTHYLPRDEPPAAEEVAA